MLMRRYRGAWPITFENVHAKAPFIKLFRLLCQSKVGFEVHLGEFRMTLNVTKQL